MNAAEQWYRQTRRQCDHLPSAQGICRACAMTMVRDAVRAKGEADAALMGEEDRENDPEDLYTGRVHRVALLRAHAADVPTPPEGG